jgi:plastocyanin
MARRPVRLESIRPLAALLGFLLGSAVAAHAGAITGKVLLPETAPAPASEASAGFSGFGAGLEGPPGIIKGTEPVIVYVAQAAGDLPQTATKGARVRILRGKATPALIPVSLGSDIVLENGDGRAHHLVCKSGKVRRDLGVLARKERHAINFDEPGTLRFECVEHSDVAFEVVVFAHAAFSLVDAKGNYTLPDLPLGHATVVAYSPRLGEISREIDVTESGSTPLDFTF